MTLTMYKLYIKKIIFSDENAEFMTISDISFSQYWNSACFKYPKENILNRSKQIMTGINVKVMQNQSHIFPNGF